MRCFLLQLLVTSLCMCIDPAGSASQRTLICTVQTPGHHPGPSLGLDGALNKSFGLF